MADPVPGICILLPRRPDVKPTEIIDQTLAFQSIDDVNAGVLGVYAGLSTHTISTNTLIADEAMWPVENNTGRGTLMYSWKQDPVNPEAIAPWQSFYQVLDRANRILDVIDEVYATPQEEGAAQISTKENCWHCVHIAILNYCAYMQLTMNRPLQACP